MKQVKIISGRHEGKTGELVACFWQLDICIIAINGIQHEVSIRAVEEMSNIKKTKFMEQINLNIYYESKRRR